MADYYECGNCGYRQPACLIQDIICDPECPSCGERLFSDFVYQLSDGVSEEIDVEKGGAE